MTHPLVDTLAKTPGADMIGEDDLESYITARQDCLTLLFFAGHSANKLETPDVAVVLIELLKGFGDHIRVAIIDQASERRLMAPCGVKMLPSIAIFHGTTHLETIAKIQDWDVYASRLPALLKQVNLGAGARDILEV